MPTTRRASAAKAAPVVEPDEDEFEEMDEDTEPDAPEDDLEELDEEVEETPAPKKRTTKKAATADGEKPARKPPVRPEIQFSSAWLAAHVTETTGETYDARGIRMLLRKMASDGTLARVVGEDRNRYEFSGPDDPTVKAVIAMIQSGEAKALKQAGLEKVKADAAAKKAAKAKAKAAAAEPEPEEDDEDVEELEDEAPAPKPRTRRAAPAKAAPAKATPATRTRRAAAAK